MPGDEVRAALAAYRAGVRARRKRIVDLLRELKREHQASLAVLLRAENAFVREIDPEGVEFVPGGEAGELFVNWRSPEWPPVAEVMGALDEVLPSDDISDALDDLKELVSNPPHGPDDGPDE